MTTTLSILLLAALIIAILCDIIRIRQYIAMRWHTDEEYKRKVAENIATVFDEYSRDDEYDGCRTEMIRYYYDHFNEIFK